MENPQAESALNSGTGNMITSNSFSQYPDAFLSAKPADSEEVWIKLFGRYDKKRVCRWVKQKYVIDNEYINAYNVLIPESNNSGALGERLTSPLRCDKMEGSTDTFISIGTFDGEYEANACIKYIKTKFVRALLGSLKVTQHNPKDTWKNVPMQDFASDRDIDWSLDVDGIDDRLFDMYGLSDDEKKFIREKIKPMA